MCIDRDGVCKSCGCEYDDLPEYSTCPSDECPSNLEEQEATGSHLSNDRFNAFISVCEEAAAPNDKLTKAFQTAKDTGFD